MQPSLLSEWKSFTFYGISHIQMASKYKNCHNNFQPLTVGMPKDNTNANSFHPRYELYCQDYGTNSSRLCNKHIRDSFGIPPLVTSPERHLAHVISNQMGNINSFLLWSFDRRVLPSLLVKLFKQLHQLTWYVIF